MAVSDFLELLKMCSVWLLPEDSLPQFKMEVAYEPLHDKTNKNDLCAQRRLRSTWAFTDAQTDLRLLPGEHVILLVLSCTGSYCIRWTFYFQYTWHILCLTASSIGQNLQVIFHHCLNIYNLKCFSCRTQIQNTQDLFVGMCIQRRHQPEKSCSLARSRWTFYV